MKGFKIHPKLWFCRFHSLIDTHALSRKAMDVQPQTSGTPRPAQTPQPRHNVILSSVKRVSVRDDASRRLCVPLRNDDSKCAAGNHRGHD